MRKRAAWGQRKVARHCGMFCCVWGVARLNTVALVLDLKQQTSSQTLKKCIKRCNKTWRNTSRGQQSLSGAGGVGNAAAATLI